MIALKSFYNKESGNVGKGKVLSKTVLKCLNVEALEKAGFIGDPKKENKATKK